MVNDAITSSNPLVVPIQNEEFKETPFNVNVSQQSCKEKLIGKVVHI